MKSTIFNFCVLFFLFSVGLEDTKNPTPMNVNRHWISEHTPEEQIFSRTSKRDHRYYMIQDRLANENQLDGLRTKSYISNTTGHKLTGFGVTEKEFYDHYKNENGGHWLGLREFPQNELITLCAEVHKRESVYQRMAFYQAEPRFQEFGVKLDIKGVEPLLVTDLLQCTVETMNTGKETMFAGSDVFYVTEGDTRGSLFRLRMTSTNSTVKIYGKTDLVY